MKIDGFDKIVAMSKDNTEAMVKSSTLAMQGMEELTKASQALAARNAEVMDAAFKALFSCKTPAELADLQSRLARESVENAIAEGRKFAELASSTVTAALEPLNARVVAFQAMAKSAA
ncbi:MAG: phasin family protein [Magnetospirillum sp.]|nr:phasin family protein [Magnetospirillum sp.]